MYVLTKKIESYISFDVLPAKASTMSTNFSCKNVYHKLIINTPSLNVLWQLYDYYPVKNEAALAKKSCLVQLTKPRQLLKPCIISSNVGPIYHNSNLTLQVRTLVDISFSFGLTCMVNSRSLSYGGQIKQYYNIIILHE